MLYSDYIIIFAYNGLYNYIRIQPYSQLCIRLILGLTFCLEYTCEYFTLRSKLKHVMRSD